jgi:hypothetical protein
MCLAEPLTSDYTLCTLWPMNTNTTQQDSLTVITNNVPRNVVDAYELTDAERAEFDYIDWPAVERGESSPTFIRYKGELLDLGEFMTTYGMPEFSPLTRWDGYHNDSFFSGTLIRYCDDFERVVVARFFA